MSDPVHVIVWRDPTDGLFSGGKDKDREVLTLNKDGTIKTYTAYVAAFMAGAGIVLHWSELLDAPKLTSEDLPLLLWCVEGSATHHETAKQVEDLRERLSAALEREAHLWRSPF